MKSLDIVAPMRHETKRINVLDKDWGIWNEELVTVQRFSDRSDCCAAPFLTESDFCSFCKQRASRDLVWCNHAGAVEETYENTIHFPEGPDQEWTVRQLVCKCGAYQYESGDIWFDAPEEGVTQ